MNPRIRPPRRPAPRDRSAGFTLIELLVVLGFLALAATLAVPAIQNLIVRSKTEGFAREASVLMQRTRLEAIKVNRDGVVHLDPDNRQLVAFIDADREGTFNPDPNEPLRTTDYVLGRLPLPQNVAFEDEAGNTNIASVLGNTDVTVDQAVLPAVIFRPNGAMAVDPDDPRDSFAFRIADMRGNILQILVNPPASGRIDIQKWEADGGGTEAWRSAGDPAADDYEPWTWR